LGSEKGREVRMLGKESRGKMGKEGEKGREG
jgi:hypothetical protein